MYIETPHGAYRVLQILAQDDSVFSCLAVRKGCGKEEVCLMQEFREPAAARELGRCLAEPGKRENSRFGVFVKEGSLWIVSRRYEGMPFGEACGSGTACCGRFSFRIFRFICSMRPRLPQI